MSDIHKDDKVPNEIVEKNYNLLRIEQQIRLERIRAKAAKRTMMAIVISTVILLTSAVMCVTGYGILAGEAMSDNIIRFHVVANSDTDHDQELKTHIRDEVIEYMRPMLKDAKSIEESREVILDNMESIKTLSQQVVEDYGDDYDIHVYLDEANFPTKSYGDIVLPAGEYEACRIIIGEGKGENWWCVMFPPLCYLDVATGVVPVEGKEQLKEELNEEQYNIITSKDAEYQIRFKLIDMIGEMLNPNDYNKVY